MFTHSFIKFGKTTLAIRHMWLTELFEKLAKEGHVNIKVQELAHEKVPKLQAIIADQAKSIELYKKIATDREIEIVKLLRQIGELSK